ncbi:MAG: hypothetical protein JNL83_12790 [Myxococcales bacterium]|nr:hypothetical protein [Myxococcales bacterium]
MSEVKTQKIQIGSKDKSSLTIDAQYNPATLEISQNVPWKKPDAANKGGGGANQQGTPKDANFMALEFTGAESRSMSIELLFDAFEGGDRAPNGKSVMECVAVLEELATPVKPDSTQENERRPHHCILTWGAGIKFQCVIENLTTKYTMFSADGTPTRATCTVKLKEAARVDRKKK